MPRQWFTILLLCVTTRVALAQSKDYSVHNTHWNGLHTVAALAKGLGYTLETPEVLDWRKISTNDIVFIVHPARAVDPQDLFSFIQRGGRVLLADDFGGSDQTLARLGFIREMVQRDVTPMHSGLDYAPIAYPWISHPLTQGVDQLITNHPAALSIAEGALLLFGFRTGQAIVAASTAGSGKLVVLSDPSILINRMVEFEGNFQFALNTLRFLGHPQPTSLYLFVGAFSSRPGSPATGTEGDDRPLLIAIADEVNELLGGLNEYVPHVQVLPIIALLLTMAILFALVLRLPMPKRGTKLWAQFFSPAPASHDLVRTIAAKTADVPRQNYLAPSLQLKELVSRRLGTFLETPDPLKTLDRAQLLSQISPHFSSADQRRWIRVCTDLQAISGPKKADLSSWPHISKGQFQRLYHRAMQLYEVLP